MKEEEQKASPKGKDPILEDSEYKDAYSDVSPLVMRKVRRMVRHTASLVSTGGPVHEVPGGAWMASFKTRTIIWRPVGPPPNFEVLSHDELLVNVVHEAGHLNYTGGWAVPDGADKRSWHRFVNWGEDIRIERLSSEALPGFTPLKHESNKAAFEHYNERVKFQLPDGSIQEHPLAAGLALTDQCGCGWMMLEEGMDVECLLPQMQEFVKRTWPKATRICNAKDTADMAEMLYPIYKELMDSQEQGRAPDADNISDDVDSKGSDSPCENPQRSPIPDDEDGGGGHEDVNPYQMILDMAGDALDDATKQKLMQWAQEEEQARAEAQAAAKIAVGDEAGRGPDVVPPVDPKGLQDWDDAKQAMRAEINALSRKLGMVLINNAMDDWEPGQRRGQLDLGAAHTSLQGNMNVFRTRTEVGALDYTFGIIVDVSSSQMSRAQPLLEATVLIAEATARAGVNMFILPWMDFPRRMKRVRQGLNDHKGHLGSTIRRPQGGTYEAPALVMAEEEFGSIHSGHKVLMTITDGQTTRVNESKSVIGELNEHGVRCIGIAVAYKAPSHYPNSLSVQTAGELVHVLPRFMQEIMRKGIT